MNIWFKNEIIDVINEKIAEKKVFYYLMLTLPAISLSWGWAAWIMLCASFVVDVVLPVVVWIDGVCDDGDPVLPTVGLNVAVGFAWPFLFDVGTTGRRGIILSFIVGTTSSSDTSTNFKSRIIIKTID